VESIISDNAFPKKIMMKIYQKYHNQKEAVIKYLMIAIIATREAITDATNVPRNAIRRMIRDGILTSSLNNDRGWLIITEELERKANRKGFYHHRIKKWSREFARFHRDREIKATLTFLATKWPWGITRKEAEEQTGRECERALKDLMEEGKIQVRLCEGKRVYVSCQEKKADIQINHRRTNLKLKRDEARSKNVDDNDEEIKVEDEIPQVITYEEILDQLRKTVEKLDIEIPIPIERLCAVFLLFFTNRSFRTIEIWLNNDPRILEAVGMIGRCVDHTTLSRAFTAIGEDVLKSIFHQLILDLHEGGVVTGRILVVDATHIFAYANTRKDTDKHPVSGAAWGNHHGSFYGYKIHLLVDADSELPIGMISSPGNEHDSPYFVPLMEDFEEHYSFDEVIAVLADGAYDVTNFRKVVNKKTGGVFLPACNPRRSKILSVLKAKVKKLFDRWGDYIHSVDDALRYLGQTFITKWVGEVGSDEESKLVELISERFHRSHRVCVERVNARLKTFSSFLRPKTRNPTSVDKTLWWCLIADVLQASTAVAMGKKLSMRRRTLVV
jgi:hypothetical protein